MSFYGYEPSRYSGSPLADAIGQAGNIAANTVGQTISAVKQQKMLDANEVKNDKLIESMAAEVNNWDDSVFERYGASKDFVLGKLNAIDTNGSNNMVLASIKDSMNPVLAIKGEMDRDNKKQARNQYVGDTMNLATSGGQAVGEKKPMSPIFDVGTYREMRDVKPATSRSEVASNISKISNIQGGAQSPITDKDAMQNVQYRNMMTDPQIATQKLKEQREQRQTEKDAHTKKYQNQMMGLKKDAGKRAEKRLTLQQQKHVTQAKKDAAKMEKDAALILGKNLSNIDKRGAIENKIALLKNKINIITTKGVLTIDEYGDEYRDSSMTDEMYTAPYIATMTKLQSQLNRLDANQTPVQKKSTRLSNEAVNLASQKVTAPKVGDTGTSGKYSWEIKKTK